MVQYENTFGQQEAVELYFPPTCSPKSDSTLLGKSALVLDSMLPYSRDMQTICTTVLHILWSIFSQYDENEISSVMLLYSDFLFWISSSLEMIPAERLD